MFGLEVRSYILVLVSTKAVVNSVYQGYKNIKLETHYRKKIKGAPHMTFILTVHWLFSYEKFYCV